MQTHSFGQKKPGLFLCVLAILFGIVHECACFPFQKVGSAHTVPISSVTGRLARWTSGNYFDDLSLTTEASSGGLHQQWLPSERFHVSDDEFLAFGLSDAIIPGHVSSTWPLNRRTVPTTSSSFQVRKPDGTETSSFKKFGGGRFSSRHHSQIMDFSQGLYEPSSSDPHHNYGAVTSVNGHFKSPPTSSGSSHVPSLNLNSDTTEKSISSSVDASTNHGAHQLTLDIIQSSSHDNNPSRMKGFISNSERGGYNERDLVEGTKISPTSKERKGAYSAWLSTYPTHSLDLQNNERDNIFKNPVPGTASEITDKPLVSKSSDNHTTVQTSKSNFTVVPVSETQKTHLDSEIDNSSIVGNFPTDYNTDIFKESSKVREATEDEHSTIPEGVLEKNVPYDFSNTTRDISPSVEKTSKDIIRPTYLPAAEQVTWIARLDNSSDTMDKEKSHQEKYPFLHKNPNFGLVNDQPALEQFGIGHAAASPPSFMSPVSEAQDSRQNALSSAAVAGIIIGIVSVAVLTGMTFLLLHHKDYCKAVNKMDSKCPPDSYIDNSLATSYMNNHIELPKESTEEMTSLDNDSFLNSLEAVTIQNYWADSSKSTKV
ncbi:uncharacterized protein LOC111088976 [Limulus polyphemus]|uniref:Uncharacterized protein LOC111088976 n=1 Tax=Limulus polyphemus TaxID=6850 RepID=A0ABM1TJX3_LIMPO|nr:uncharacterized protein LOC111088976 [Limulus polyphemus]XP_022256180.1 uncharacterized protein LOC111088976 [Limulus polyphemus]